MLVFCGFICGMAISRYIMGSFGIGCRQSYFIHPKINVENIHSGYRHGNEIPKSSKIYIGMMSSAKYLSTRVQRNVDTWAQKGGWKIDVFTSPGLSQLRVPKDLNLDIITLPGVDDNAYPPQKKSFMLLRYMHDYHINDYDWFVRADDDSYTDFPRLERLLNKLNSSLPIFLGSPGFGMDEDDGIEEGMRYLMGGLGMIFSRGLLIQLRPHIKYCIQHLYSPHEDIEIGRCVWKHTKVVFPVAWELVDLFYQQYDKDTGDVINILMDQLTPKRTAKTVTYHSVKTPELMYRLHKQVLERDMHTALNRTARLQNEIAHMEQMIELSKTMQSEDSKNMVIPLIPGPSNLWKDEQWPPDAHWYPANASFNKASFDLPWFHFDRYYRNDAKDSLVPKRGHSSVEKAAIADMLVDIEGNLMQISCPNFPSNVQLNYGYIQTGSLEGFRVVTVHRSSAGSTIKFCRTISQMSYGVVMSQEEESIFQRHESLRKALNPSGSLLERAMKDILAGGENDDHDRNMIDHGHYSLMPIQSAMHIYGKIIFVIPLQGRYRALELFMERYERDFLIPAQKNGKISDNLQVQLAIVLLGNDDQGDDLGLNLASAHLLKSYQNTYGSELLRYHVASTGDRGFSRGAGIQLGSLIGGEHDILFFMDIDMIVTPNLAERCQAIAQEGNSVWYPVSFSQYDPEKLCYNDDIDSTNKQEIRNMRNAELRSDKRTQREAIKQTPRTLNSNRGFWRDFGFGIACMHKADFIKTGGFDLSIEGWGEEDIRLFLSLLKSGMDVFRSRQVDLIHIFHQKYCDPNIPKEQSQACYRTRASHFASQRCLAEMWDKGKA